jgi:predicted flap endonuclease-1-like 5' DNA nuclease
MSDKIQSIEGIGPHYAEKLSVAGIRTTKDLLIAGADPSGRSTLSLLTGIDEGQILKWVNMCDLFRIKGVAGQYAELLEAAGVDTVKELRNRNHENLAIMIHKVNQEKRLVRQVPASNRLEGWIDQARKLEPMVSY